MTEAAISIQNLSKRFGNFEAVKQLSLEIPRQTLFGLLGPNGAGKTTLFSLITGFLIPSQGQISVLGVPIQRIADLQGRLSILPQDALFQKNVPILDQMIFFSRLSGKSYADAEREAKEALEMVGLGEVMKRSAGVLSHGMTKRLGIAQAFLGRPEVILLDEPTSGLDPVNARKMRDLIRELKGKTTLIISSHNLHEIQEICDYVAIMDRGQLLTSGSVEEITRSARDIDITFSRELTATEIEELQRTPGVRSVVVKEYTQYTISMDLSKENLSQDQLVASVLKFGIEKNAFPRRLSQGMSLENFFLKVTGENEKPEKFS